MKRNPVVRMARLRCAMHALIAAGEADPNLHFEPAYTRALSNLTRMLNQFKQQDREEAKSECH